MMYCLTILSFVVIILIKNVLNANILYIAPVASPSHHVWNRALAFGLTEKGHNVTMIAHDAEKDPLPNNFTLILLEGFYQQETAALDMDVLLQQTPFSNILEMYAWARSCCEHDLGAIGLQTLMNYPDHYNFDIIIYDITVGQCLYPLIQRFHNPPVVAVTPFLLPPVFSSSFGNHLHTSYMPFYNSDFTNQMSLLQRILNFIYTYSDLVYRNYVFMPMETDAAKNRFGKDIPSLEETERNISMLLCNIDPVLDYPLTLPPNIVAVGGLHVKSPSKLPSDLQRILDGAKDGVVLFSLGTNVRSDQLDATKRKALLEAFAKIPQLVLWKFETENVKGLPKNVVVRKWLPQNDILGHKNIRLFISHGGALSTQEAMYHGVPILGIPIFSDQNVNVAKMVRRTLAKSIDIRTITSEIMYETLTEMLNNPVYLTNVKRVSKLYRDQAQTPLERAVFWIEYVLRNGNAEHLVLPARDMSFFQTANIDVLAVLVLGVVLIYYFTLLVITSCRFIRMLIFD